MLSLWFCICTVSCAWGFTIRLQLEIYISLSFQKVGAAKKGIRFKKSYIVSLILLLSAPIRDNRPALSPFLFIHLWLPLHTQTLVTVAVCVCVCCQECACVYYRRTIMLLLLLLESIPRSLCAAGPPPASIHISLSSLASLFLLILLYYTIILLPFFLQIPSAQAKSNFPTLKGRGKEM